MAEQIMPLEKTASGPSSSHASELRDSNIGPDHTPILGDLEGADGRSTIRNFLRNFSSLWFTIALDAGILSVIMHILPYHFKGLPILSTIMFVLALAIYIIVWACFIARWTMYWEETRHRIFNDVEEIALTGAPAIVWFTIAGLVALKCSEVWGYGFTVLAYVMWWIGMAWIIIQCSTLFVCLSKESLTDDEHLPTAVFLPIVGVMTAASIGGIICNNAVHISARMALPVIVVSYLCLGFALFLSLAVYAAYLHRLIVVGWPPLEKIPAMILTIGPMGQSSTALQTLASAANQKHVFAQYNKGFFLQREPAQVIQATSTLLALLLLGFALFWIIIAYFAIIQATIHRRLHPGLVWWSTIFPMGTVATATVNLASAMDSPAFRIIASGLLVFLVLIFLINTFLTIPMVLTNRARRIRHPFQHHKTFPGTTCRYRT